MRVSLGAALLAVVALQARPSLAQAQMTIYPGSYSPINQTTQITNQAPITWSTVGLDSNNVNVGPNLYLVGARVRNSGTVALTNVTGTLVWNACPGGGAGTGTCDDNIAVPQCIDVVSPNVTSYNAGSLAVGSTQDFVFNVTVRRDSACHFRYRPYHITVSSTEAATVSTATGRTNQQIFVEKLISQNRNGFTAISGPANVYVGGTFQFTLDTSTATGGYSSHETFLNFPNHIFRFVSVNGCYQEPPNGGSGVACTAAGLFAGNGTFNDKVWANACDVIEDPADASNPDKYKDCYARPGNDCIYPFCTGGNAGNAVRQIFTVTILDSVATGTTVPVAGVLYDGSGSSYHYPNSVITTPGTCGVGGTCVSPACICVTINPPPTALSMKSASATRRGDGAVHLEWQTGDEVRNVGFRVYREEGRQKLPASSLIAGSAIMAGVHTPLKAGNAYRWTDRDAASHPGATYWLESLDANGTARWHGPIEVERGDFALVEGSPLLSELNARVSASARRESDAVRVLGPVNVPLETGDEGESFARTSPLAASPTGAQNQQFTLAGQPAAKLSVDKAGWYSVPRSALQAIGFNVGLDPRKLQLYADGVQQPISVLGEADGAFGTSDSVGFYGTGLDTPTTDTRTYYLINGSKGSRINKSAFGSAPAQAADSFLSTIDFRERTFFYAGLPNGEAESFFGAFVYNASPPTNQVLTATNVDTTAPGDSILTVSLQGGIDDATINPDHHVEVKLNGAYVGEIFFDGQELKTVQLNVPSSLVNEGANTVTLTALGAPLDISLVNYIQLSYWHTYVAEGGRLAFSATGGYQAKVSGFTSGAVRVFDVTSPSAPVELGTSVAPNGGTFDVTVKVPGTTSRSLLAVQDDAAGSPGLKLNSASSLNARGTTADLLIIGHGSVLSNAAPLVAQRQSEGYRVVTADVEDVFDEFSFGAHDPAGIKSFVSWTRSSWKAAPRYLLLLGDASFDPRNYLGFGDLDLVPTKLLVTEFLKTSSDDWLADFNADGVADIAVGRMPARNASEADVMVGKAVGYSSATGDWTGKVLLVSGANDGQGNDFPGSNAAVGALIPAGTFDIHPITVGQAAPTARTDLLTRWNSGALFLNFLGHGSTEVWANGLFGKNDAYALTNTGKLPFVVGLTCLTGFFHDLFTESIGEALLRSPQGGAVAVWGSSALTFLEGQRPADEELTRQLFDTAETTIGDAVLKAKLATSDFDVRHSWILLGDPTTKLRKP